MSNSWTLQRDSAVRVLRPEGAVYETAAAQLLRYLNALCGITEARSQSAPAIILRTDPSMPPDAFRLVVRGNDLHLVGQNGRGVLYAVFALAERFGCRFFAHDTEVIPHPAELSLPDGLDVTEASPFAYRDLYWIGTTDPLTAVKLRINGTGLKSGQHIRHLTAEVGGGIGYAGPHFVHTIDLLLPFVCVHPAPEKIGFPRLKSLLKYGKQEVLTRLDVPFYTRKGYQKNYLGPAMYHSLRYGYRYGDYLQMGITAEKDAGEPFFALHNEKGYDYYSIYFLLRNLGKLKTLALGNYRLSFGQGLVVSTDFRLGKNSYTLYFGK